ncbi:MAG: phosphoenolpyruvate--protein phosphotransferase [Treponema sp.]|jgi:phosphotransferase system enzyme I (PtsI)|nr:phosphoenolpyruvate--protein phosphotransferase [Treponema sp.]
MKTYTGIPASPGLAIGRAFVYPDDEIPEIPRYSIRQTEVPAEWERLQKAISEAAGEVKALHERAEREMSRDQADIFQAHLLMLEDVDFQDQLRDRLTKSLQNIEWVVWDTVREISQKLLDSPEPLFRERAVDISDVSRRVISRLLCFSRTRFSLAGLDEDIILVAHDLLPSDALVMNKSRVKGLAMDTGSRTCHTAILARAFNIPAVLGLSAISREINDGEMLVLNGASGTVTVDPDRRTLARQEEEEREHREQRVRLIALRDLPAETIDGRRVALKANIEFPEEAERVLNYGAEGIGLYRSEFLYIAPGRSAEEETQYRAYSHVLKTMEKLPVTIRTVDVGGDKVLPELQTVNEKNPLLGWRAIRFSLAHPELFKVQLRAILRASVAGNARIMFPMISGVEELDQALALLNEARAECAKKGQSFAADIDTGVMIEIPSAAMTADILAEKADFFSLGTNDLIQYTLAVDRGNEKVNYLGDPCHPAVVRLLKRVIDAAHEKGIKAAMCGELAGDARATAILLGLGLDEFSMTASAIPQVKQIIRSVSMESCVTLAEACLAGRSVQEIRGLLDAWIAENIPLKQHGI